MFATYYSDDPYGKKWRGAIEVADRNETMQLLVSFCEWATWGRVMVLLPTRREAQRIHRRLQTMLDRPVRLLLGPGQLDQDCVAVCGADDLKLHHRKHWRMLLLPDGEWAIRFEGIMAMGSVFGWSRYIFIPPSLNAEARERLSVYELPVIRRSRVRRALAHDV